MNTRLISTLTNIIFFYTGPFHTSCVGFVEELDSHRGTSWCCSLPCYQQSQSPRDSVLAYTKALGYRAIVDVAKRRIIREGDGIAINDEWRLDVLDYINGNHKNYMVIGHNLAASKYKVSMAEKHT